MRDDGSLETCALRYQRARAHCDEQQLVVTANFNAAYTFDEVDVTQVVKGLLRNETSEEEGSVDIS